MGEIKKVKNFKFQQEIYNIYRIYYNKHLNGESREMGVVKKIDEELKRSMENIKEKIKSDDILNRILNKEAIQVNEGEIDWKVKCGQEIVEIYKKLVNIIDKLKVVS